MRIIQAHTAAHLPVVRELFVEYAKAIAVDLCFQSFDRELAELPGLYAPPDGRLLLAFAEAEAAGCAALRNIGEGICEMKRLYVRPAFRRKGLGRTLANRLVAAASRIGYDRMRLDTLSSMREAIRLYESLGFRRIAPYNDNPLPDAVFLELALDPRNPAGAARQ